MRSVKRQPHCLSVHGFLYTQQLGPNSILILNLLAPRHGFEPRFTAPKAAVLPLDDRGMRKKKSTFSVAYRSRNHPAAVLSNGR